MLYSVAEMIVINTEETKLTSVKILRIISISLFLFNWLCQFLLLGYYLSTKFSSSSWSTKPSAFFLFFCSIAKFILDQVSIVLIANNFLTEKIGSKLMGLCIFDAAYGFLQIFILVYVDFKKEIK